MAKESRKGKRHATIADVAAAAGVSRSTASRAMSGTGYVAQVHRDQVRKAAELLDYVPNSMARQLKQRESRTIGVFVFDLMDPFYSALAAGISDAARNAGYGMFLADGRSDEEELTIVRRLVSMRVAGIVSTPLSAKASALAISHDVPVVEVDRRFNPDKCDAVVVDNRGGASQATTHLLQAGYHDIALLIDETEWTTGSERVSGFEQAMRDSGRAQSRGRVIRTGRSVAEAQEKTQALLSGSSRPSAIFAGNNVLAEGALRAIDAEGLGVPGDIALVAFDDFPWMSLVRPGITAIAQEIRSMGQSAVERLLGRLHRPDSPPLTVTLPVRLVPRGSTASSVQVPGDSPQASPLGQSSTP